jgi:PPP family 3-phenylpropionic acid transporter
MLAEMRGDTSRYGRIRLWGSLGFIAAVMAGRRTRSTASASARCRGWRRRAAAGAGAIAAHPRSAAPHAQGSAAAGVRGAAPAGGDRLLRAGRADGVGAIPRCTPSTRCTWSAGYSKTLIGAMWSLGVLAEVVFFYFQASVLRRSACAPR